LKFELGVYSHRVQHRPGLLKTASDTLLRVCSTIGQPANFAGISRFW